MGIITWLHLSDFHIKSTPGYRYNDSLVLGNLLNKVETHIFVEKQNLDFLFVTGDLTHGGKGKEFENVHSFFDKLLDITGLPKNRVFIVPGNHDVDRDEVSKMAVAAGEKGLECREDIINFFTGKKEERRLIFRRLDNYVDFVEDYLEGNLRFFDDKPYYTKKIRIGNKRLALIGLNSAWLCYGGDTDKNKILIGAKQVIDAVRETKDSDFKIALVHHPFNLLKDFDYDEVQRWLRGNCDIILRGHRHLSDAVFEQSPQGKNLVITAGASYEDRTYHNSFNFASYNMDSRKGQINNYTFNPQVGEFERSEKELFDLSKEVFSDRNRFGSIANIV